MIFRFSLIALVSLTVMSGCASRGGGEWRGVPEDTMPETLNAWDVYWDDSRQNWREARSDARVEQSAVPTESWEFESNAIALRIEASEELNRFRGASHTLLLHIYQVRDPGGVTRHLETPAELRRLLRRGDDDPDVLDVEAVILEPGRTCLVQLDRVGQARYLVLVAGYAEGAGREVYRILPIPQIYDVPRGLQRFAPGNVTTTINPFSSKPDPRPGRLSLWLTAGDTSLVRLEGLAQ